MYGRCKDWQNVNEEDRAALQRDLGGLDRFRGAWIGARKGGLTSRSGDCNLESGDWDFIVSTVGRDLNRSSSP